MATKKNPKHLTSALELNDTQRLRLMGAKGYKPVQRKEGAAEPNGINLMRQPDYNPARDLGARMGIAQ